MRRCPRASALLPLVLAAGCAARTGPRELAGAPPATLGGDAAAARAVAIAFLELEARGDTAADTLLAPGADFLMTGIRVTMRPRAAGINGPGLASADEVTTGTAGAFAWVVLSYRITARTPALSERGRGTFILERQRDGWRIRHAHTSMVGRW